MQYFRAPYETSRAAAVLREAGMRYLSVAHVGDPILERMLVHPADAQGIPNHLVHVSKAAVFEQLSDDLKKTPACAGKKIGQHKWWLLQT